MNHQLDVGSSSPVRLGRQQANRDQADRPHVRGWAHRLHGTPGLFGCHVERRTHYRPLGRDTESGRIHRVKELRYPEIQNLRDHAAVFAAVEEDVFGLQISMNDPDRMRLVEGTGDLPKQLDHEGRLEPAQLRRGLLEVESFEKLHDEERSSFELRRDVGVGHPHDVLALDLSADPRLALETRNRGGVGGGRAVQQLEGEVLPRVHVLDDVDDAHPATAKLANDSIARCNLVDFHQGCRGVRVPPSAAEPRPNRGNSPPFCHSRPALTTNEHEMEHGELKINYVNVSRVMQVPTRDPFRGTPFRAIRRLKVRQFTEIYEVEAPGGRCLAKILRAECLSMPQVVDRMRLEADILSSLNHPNVVRLFDRGKTPEKRPYLVLERLVGHTLRRELVKRGASPIAQAVDLVLQALDGVDAVHRLGIVHRDLKPDNLFLARTKARGRTLKILDFGFAKVLGESTGSTYIAPLAISTSEREFVGAPRYVSPEQLLAGKHVDYRADIYTLGLILYLLVLGREPHHDVDSQSELLRAQLEGHLDPPSTETAKRVPDELMAIIWRATAMDPTGRFWSANEFAAELRQFVDQQRPAARTPTLSIQQHAELTAAIEVEPTRVDELRARYGVISRAQVQAVEAWWKQNVANDPKVHAKWRALVDLYVERFRKIPES